MSVQNMMLLLHVDASLNIGGLVGHRVATFVVLQTSHCWMDAMPWSPMAWRSFKMSRTVPSWATLFLQELIHGQFDLKGALAVMQERPPVCVTECKSLHDHLSVVGSPSTLHDKRPAIAVLIIRESMTQTGCVVRWAPTGLFRRYGCRFFVLIPVLISIQCR